jgi:hypothetical protein
LEDERQLTSQRFTEAGIPVTMSLKGIGEVKKFLNVFKLLPDVVNRQAFFIIDNDKGMDELSHFCQESSKDKIESNFTRYRVTDRVFVILLPPGFRVEDLFDEFEDVLEECFSQIYDESLDFRDRVPTKLARAVAALRGKRRPTSVAEAKDLMRNENDVKNIFWERVEQSGYQIAQSHRGALRSLMNIE